MITAGSACSLYSEMIILSCHSAGTLSDFQTWVMRACSAELTGSSAVQAECYLILQHRHSPVSLLLTSVLGLLERPPGCRKRIARALFVR